jgi:hypothetical protein
MRARNTLACALSALAVSACAAAASEPVPRTIEACVIGGAFRGPQYTYRVHVIAGGEWRRLDLSAYEGMTLRMRGFLLPGDNFTMRTLEIVAETCLRPPR